MKPNILLIEPNPYDAEFICETLHHTQDSIQVVHVTSSSDAMDFLFGTGTYKGRDVSQRPMCILLSLPLPNREGLALLATLKSYASIRTIPVITLAQNCNDALVEQALTLGANNCIVKGQNAQLLIDCVQQYRTSMTR